MEHTADEPRAGSETAAGAQDTHPPLAQESAPPPVNAAAAPAPVADAPPPAAEPGPAAVASAAPAEDTVQDTPPGKPAPEAPAAPVPQDAVPPQPAAPGAAAQDDGPRAAAPQDAVPLPGLPAPPVPLVPAQAVGTAGAGAGPAQPSAGGVALGKPGKPDKGAPAAGAAPQDAVPPPVATGLPDTTTTVFAPPRPTPAQPTVPTVNFVPSEPRPVAAGPGPVRAVPPQPAPAPQRLPGVPTPESVPTVDPRLAPAVGAPRRADSLARRTAHSLLRKGRAGDTDALVREVQLPVQTGRVVAVTSIRGGGGKTTVAALLGRTFNHYRQDPVLTLEADAALGTLAVRMGAESVRWSCPDLAQLLNPRMRLMDVTGYLIPVADGGWLLPASQGVLGAPLDVPTYRRVTLSMRRYFAMTVVDCETLPGEVARTAMDTSHARVVVAPMTAEGVGGTRVVLDWLAGLPQAALASTAVVLTAQSPDMTLDSRAAVAHLKQTGVPVVYLPYDRHLAQGGPIRTELLAASSRDAALRLAAETMQRAARVG